MASAGSAMLPCPRARAFARRTGDMLIVSGGEVVNRLRELVRGDLGTLDEASFRGPAPCGGAREGARCSQHLCATGGTAMSDITEDFNFLQGVKVVDFTQFEAGTTS